MKTSTKFKLMNGIASALIVAPIMTTATTALAQDTEDDLNETNEVEVYHNDFESNPDSDPAIQDAGSELTYTNDLDFEGNNNNSGVWVTERGDDWRGIDVRFDALDLEVGQEYSVRALGYIAPEEEIPEEAQLTLQYPDTYGGIDGTDVTPGEPFVLGGDYIHTDEEDEDGNSPVSFRVQSNDAGKDVEFAIADILVTTEETTEEDPGQEEDPVEDEDPEESEEDEVPSEIETLYHETFQEGLGHTIQAGNATLTELQDFTIGDQTGAVYITNREDNHDGLDIRFDSIDMERGYTYDITVHGYVGEEEEPNAGDQAVIQIPSGDYPVLGEADFVPGEEFIIEDSHEWTDETHEAFRIQSSWVDGGRDNEISFYVTEVLIEYDSTQTPGEDDENGEDLPPAEEFTLIDFEDGELNGFEGRDGNEELEVRTDANAIPEDGERSLHVSNRQDTHQGPTLEVTDYINVGETYEVSVWVKNDSDMTADITLSSQVGDESPTYINIASENVSPEDDWVLLQGAQRYTSVGDGYVNIYVESANADLEFYIDGIDFQQIPSEPVDPELDLPSIAEVYENDFLIGNAVSATEMEGSRLDLLTHHHNLVTAENAMKPDELVDDNREFAFDGANALAERVYEEGLELHGHVLVWHSQSPDWHHTGEDGAPLSRNEALDNMQNHIRTVMTNFGPEVKSWDVVNEALDGNWENPEDWESNLRNTGWRRAIGDDYLYEAFKYAREIADDIGREDMILYYNDYNDHIQPKAQTMYHMIKDINEQWANENPNEERKLISGVGMQGHYSININPESVKESIERFEQLGIDIGITELDVTTNTANEYVEDEIIRQGQVYARLFQIFQEHSDSIERVLFWGLNDSNSWRSERYPLLFDDQLKAKPAYHAVINPDEFLEEHPIEDAVGNQSYAVYGTPEMGNDDIDNVWNDAPVLNMNQMQQAHEVAATGNGRVLWDEDNLYVLLQVSDSVLDATAEEAHEQDSVEAFINETGEAASSYVDGVGQYRVNFENEATFNPGSYSEGFESTATITDSGYVVEMAVPWKDVTPEAWHTIGFDIQINDAVDGERHGVVAWNDDSGQGYTDPSVFGELTLIDSIEELIFYLEERITALEGAMDDYEEASAELVAELAALQSMLASLQNELGEANETISDLEDRIRELEERLAELEESDEEEPTDPTEPEELVEIEEGVQTPIQPGQTGILEEGSGSVTMPTDLPEGTEILVEYVDEADLPTLEAEGGYTLVIAGEVVEVSLIFPEGEEDFEGNYTLTLSIDEEFLSEEVFVYYYNEDTELWERREAEVDGETITAEVTHFSLYGVFALEDSETGAPGDFEEEIVEEDDTEDDVTDTDSDEDNGEELPQTATATWTIGLMGLIGAISGAGLHFIRKKK